VGNANVTRKFLLEGRDLLTQNIGTCIKHPGNGCINFSLVG
jgi:hypothetical protein